MNIVILAAGKGVRMRSALPKVLHPVAGQPMIAHVVSTARQFSPAVLAVVHGHGGDLVIRHFSADSDIQWVQQAEQLGTGHAVKQALPVLDPNHPVLVLYGDVPGISVETLSRLLSSVSSDKIALLTANLSNPTGYGRIVRNEAGKVIAIVEEKDAAPEQKAITETNTGILVVPYEKLARWLAQLNNENAQGEYYLTDIIAMAANEGVEIVTAQPDDVSEIQGANNFVQLAELERQHQRRVAEKLMASGVRIVDPARIDVRGTLVCGKDVSIDVGCIFEGNVTLDDNVSVGAYCVLRNVHVGAGTKMEPFCHLDDASMGQNVKIGPYSRLRPGAELADEVHVGNFVEIKKAQVGDGSKVNHLTYIGDATIGKRVNIGAGTITCNYDGVNKHRTIIGDDVFIGSDTQLVAPVTVGNGATIGAGTTLTKDAPENALTLSRSPQKSVQKWQRPVKKV